MNYNTNEEVWKPVRQKGFEKYYEVSNRGRVRSVDRVVHSKRGPLKYKGRLIKASENSDGYPTLNLCYAGKKNNVRVHRLVAESFIPNPERLPEINHIDEDKANNDVSNLEWCTRKYNMNHGTAVKRMMEHPNRNRAHETSKRKVIGVSVTNKSTVRFDSLSEVDDYGFNRRNVWAVLEGQELSHKGYLWFDEEKYSERVVDETIKKMLPKRVALIDEKGNILKVYKDTKEVVEELGVDSSAVSRVCNGRQKSTKGYILKYI